MTQYTPPNYSTNLSNPYHSGGIVLNSNSSICGGFINSVPIPPESATLWARVVLCPLLGVDAKDLEVHDKDGFFKVGELKVHYHPPDALTRIQAAVRTYEDIVSRMDLSDILEIPDMGVYRHEDPILEAMMTAKLHRGY